MLIFSREPRIRLQKFWSLSVPGSFRLVSESSKSHGTQTKYPKPDKVFLSDSLVPFSTFTTTLLDQHKTSFIEMADILRFSANITEETLIASTRLLVYAYARRLLADPG